MLKISISQSLKLIIILVCCMINIYTIQADQNLTRANYETLYKLRLKWEVEDLNKILNALNHNLSDLEKRKQQTLYEIETLKKEKFISYHLNKNFNMVYRKPHLSYIYYISQPVLAMASANPQKAAEMIFTSQLLDIGRFILAYGLFPFTIPATTIYSTTEWASKKNNEEKIAQLKVTLQKIQNDISILEQKINVKEPIIQQRIRELKTESLTMEKLEDFIPTYKSGGYTGPASLYYD